MSRRCHAESELDERIPCAIALERVAVRLHVGTVAHLERVSHDRRGRGLRHARLGERRAGRGVSGTMPGTDPLAAVIAKENRRRR